MNSLPFITLPPQQISHVIASKRIRSTTILVLCRDESEEVTVRLTNQGICRACWPAIPDEQQISALLTTWLIKRTAEFTQSRPVVFLNQLPFVMRFKHAREGHAAN